uniref:HEAT repeat-containing protein 1 n=1 Tax=Ascaris lumbricoides TaxID=6252 RepID=A0A0M3HYB9_ASCLU
MTSLQRQLESLRTAATSQLGVERFAASLLFDKKQAASLSKEDALKIGQSGLAQLRKIDASICKDDADLFDETALNMERSLLSKEENEKLDAKIDRLLAQISPYLQHFAAQQVLEWLLFKFQIHEFNAQRVFVMFLPFHSTNIFGRLISVLRLKGIEYDWVRPYAKAESPIRLQTIVSKCFSANHSLLSLLHQHVDYLFKLVGAQYMENKMPQLFSFYATLCVHIVADPAKVNDVIISRIIPFLATALKSHLVSLRLAALMTLCQLCVSVTLTDAVVNSLLKLVLLKINESSIQQSTSAAVVICQHQSVNILPLKGVKKLARKSGEMNISECIIALSKKTDLSSFMPPLWRAIFQLIAENAEEEETRLQLCSFLCSLIENEIFSASLATTFFSDFFEFISSGGRRQLTEEIYKRIRTLVIRFAKSFDSVRAEWQVREANVVDEIIKECKIEAYEVGDLMVETKPPGRRRRRSSSIRKSVGDDEKYRKHIVKPEKSAQLVAEEQINALRVQIKEVFKGDPMEKMCKMIEGKQWDKAKLALETLVSPRYIKQRTADDFEEFITEMVKITSSDTIPIKADVRNALAQLPIKSELALLLLARSSPEPEEKRMRGKFDESRNRRIFVNEDENVYKKRVIFVLEVLNANKCVQPSSKLFSTLFDVLKLCMQQNDEEHSINLYIRQLAVSLLVRLLKEPCGYAVKKEDIQLECIVETIRNTRDHATLRSCLSLLTAAVHISPSAVLTHMMSVFTFMGAGLLKKDNDLTLEIIEQTLSTMFAAVMDEEGEALQSRLLSVSRVLAASLLDMPAHRRLSVVRAVAKAATATHLSTIVAVLFEYYCLSWQRNEPSKGRSTVEVFEELATEMASLFGGDEQLSCVVDLLQYVVQLGGDFTEMQSSAAPRLLGQNASKSTLNGYGSTPPRFVIFDRSKHSVQKLRHYRFAILSDMNDTDMYERLLVVGKRMLVTSVELDELVNSEAESAEASDGELRGTQHSNHYKYWIAFASRADILADKLRNILPASVSARLIADVLEDSETSDKMRDRALHLLNVKLTQETSFTTEGAISTEHLDAFAGKLNQWLKPVESKNEVVLCQNAAFSLKLIARRIPATDNAPALSKSIALCSELASDFLSIIYSDISNLLNHLNGWRGLDEAMVGSLLLLAGELVRNQSTRSTLKYVSKLCTVAVDVLAEQLERPGMLNNAVVTEELSTERRRRVAQQSLSGRRIGGDVLLQCSLTCLQRVVENFVQFISTHLAQILVTLARTLARHHATLSAADAAVDGSGRLPNVEHRIVQIRKALTKLEMRLIVEPFREATEALIMYPEAEVALFSMLSACLQTKERRELLKYLPSICDQFFIAFGSRIANRSVECYDQVVDCEGRLIGYLMDVIDCLSENECRPIFAQFSKWAEEALDNERADDNALRLITVFNLFNRFYASYNALSLPHFGRIFEMVPRVLQRTNARLTSSESLLFSYKKGSIGARDMNALIVLALNLVEKCARHHEFFVEERCQLVIDDVINELDNTTVAGHEQRCIPHLAECLLQIADCHNDALTEMTNKIMLKTRSTSPKVRYCTLLVLERMFDRMGDAVAPLLPSVLPFLSELLEDEKKKVEEQCDKVIALLRKKFGEEIAEGYIQY